MPTDHSPYSAAPQGLGYIYQPRFGLLKILDFPESTAVLIEKEEDLDFIEAGGKRSLASLKHKAPGDRLNDLSTYFSRPGKPTDNAFIEAINGRFRAECLNQHWFLTLAHARDKMEDWRIDYNEFRPHGAIGNRCRSR